MALPLRIRLTPLPDGSLHVLADDRHTRSAVGVLPAAAVEALRADVSRQLAPKPGVMIAGRDGGRSRAEEAVGRSLASVLAASPALTAGIAGHLGEARGRGELSALVVDAEEGWLRDLPWELLTAPDRGAPLERTGEAAVVRLAPGRRAQGTARTGAGVKVWCPGEDPASQAVRRQLSALAAELGMALSRADPFAEVGEPASVLHIICHGEGSFEQLRLRLGGAAMDPADLAHRLGPSLASLRLVVLDVCDAGGATREELDGLAARLIAAGAPACVAPRGRCAVAAAARFSEGLYRALSDGAELAGAVVAGRREVGGLGHPHPDSRWHNHLLVVGDMETLSGLSGGGAGWRPEGWPAPSAESAALLDRAWALAGGERAPFVGLEHLALALEGGAEGEVAPRVRTLLMRRPGALAGHISALVPVANTAPDTRGTPRLRGLAGLLKPGFTPDDLWTVICQEPGHALHRLAGGSLGVCIRAQIAGGATLRTLSGQGVGGAPAARLEVVGGPEDGRVLALSEGDEVGRWDTSRAIGGALYEGRGVTDPRLSRTHAIWRGPAMLHAQRGMVRVRMGREESVSGLVEVASDDLLILGSVTWLRGVE